MPPRVERQSRRVVDQPHGLNFVAAVKQLLEVGGQFAKHTAQVVVGLRRGLASQRQGQGKTAFENLDVSATANGFQPGSGSSGPNFTSS